MKTGYNILIVDDELEYQKVVSMILSRKGYQTSTCSNGKEALAYLAHAGAFRGRADSYLDR